METRINKRQIAALGIGITFGGLMACMLANLGLPGRSLILSIGLLMGPISLIIASVVALFHPRIGGWWLIITGFTTGALFYFGDPYDKIFVHFLWCMPQIVAGVLWLGSGVSLSRVSKQFDQVNKKHLLMKIGSIFGLLFIIIASFTPYMSVVEHSILGPSETILHYSKHDQWCIWEIAKDDDLRPYHRCKYTEKMPPYIDLMLRIGPWSSILGILLMSVGFPGVFIRRLRKLTILIPIASIIIMLFTGINGLLLGSGVLRYGVYKPGSLGYWEPGHFIPSVPSYPGSPGRYIAPNFIPGSSRFVEEAIYRPEIGLMLIFIGALLLLIVYAKSRRGG